MRLMLPGMTLSGTFEPDGKGTYRIIGGATKADAVLMVAAPELLAALHRMTGEFLTQIQFTPGGNAEVFHACLAQAKAALDKAEWK